MVYNNLITGGSKRIILGRRMEAAAKRSLPESEMKLLLALSVEMIFIFERRGIKNDGKKEKAFLLGTP